MKSLIDPTRTEHEAHEIFNTAFESVKMSTNLRQLTGCQVYTKDELIRIILTDSKFDLSDPKVYARIMLRFLEKPNIYFIRFYRGHDYNISVLPNDKFLIKS